MTENKTETLETNRGPAKKKRRSRLSQETLDAIRTRLREGATQAQVAREFGLHPTIICYHVKKWPEVQFHTIGAFEYPIRER